MCVWPQRRPGSLSAGAGGPMGVLGIRGSVGSRRREPTMSTHEHTFIYRSKWCGRRMLKQNT